MKGLDHDRGRMDLEVGSVPDYRTFVRHLWAYEEPGRGSCIAPPPWVYACVFEDRNEALLARAGVQSVLNGEAIEGSRLEAVELVESRWEVRFADLEALYLFLLHVGAAAQFDVAARQVGEFLMWTLGFRWV